MIKQLICEKVEDSIEPFRPKNSEVSDIEILKNVFHGNHAANFSNASLQLSLKTTFLK